MTREPTERDDGPESPIAGLADSRRGLLRKAAAASAAVGLGIPGTAGATGTIQEDPFAFVDFGNQTTAGGSVEAEAALLEEGGYVVVHDLSLFEGEVLRSTIGASDYLEPGGHESVEVDLYDVPGGEFKRDRPSGETELVALQEDQPLVAMAHRETSGNETFDFLTANGNQDGPYLRAGTPVVDVGYVSVDSTAEVTFQNQETDGTAVLVDSATLSDGGFVAVHDMRLLQGQVAASVVGTSGYLEPGLHNNLRIQLFDVPGGEFERDQLGSTQPLIAMPHRDTDGNETYDFVSSGGETDGPYTAGGDPVVGIAYAVVGSE